MKNQSMLEKMITEHPILNKKEIENILKGNSVCEIDEAMSNLLSKNDMDNYLSATRFFRDIVNYKIRSYSGLEVIESYHELKFFKLIENNLFSNIPLKRQDSAYTLGKVCSMKSIPKLWEAIKEYENIDSVYAEALSFELRYLVGNWSSV